MHIYKNISPVYF